MPHKTYVVDTNVLLDNHEVLTASKHSHIVVPVEVVQELDHFKTKPGAIGYNARQCINYLDTLSKQGDITEGVTNEHGCVIAVIMLLFGNADEAVANLANQIKDASALTNDTYVRLLARLWGGTAEKIEQEEINTGFTGKSELTLDQESFEQLRDKGYIKSPVEFPPNQMVSVSLDWNEHDVIHCIMSRTGYLDVCDITSKFEVMGKIHGKNAEQNHVIKLLLEPSIPLVTVSGPAGSGKTLLSVACALHQVIEQPREYSKLIVAKPLVPMGREIGFLPGSETEKLMPWMGSIIDSLNKLFVHKGKTSLDNLILTGNLELCTLQYIRGRSIEDCVIIVDEAQNLTKEEIKALITRVGKGSKLILCGDSEQTDLRGSGSGLTHAVECLKDSELSGHLTLTEGQRSDLATLAAKIL